MRSVYNFWCISFVSSEFLKHVHDLPSESRKNNFTGLKNTQNCLFSSHLLFRQLWTEVLGHFRVPGAFSNAHRSNPSPHPTNNWCWTSVSRIFSEFQLCIGCGEGELQENFEKDALFRGNREMTEKYEYCSTVLRTFVQDCSYFQMAAIKLPSQENCFLQMKWRFFYFIEWRTSYFLSSLLLEIRTLKPS